jgi:short-subunit dehydrogenase
MLLKNKTILITGASRGIGKEMAMLFAREGANLILLARNLSHLHDLKHLLTSQFDINIHIFFY